MPNSIPASAIMAAATQNNPPTDVGGGVVSLGKRLLAGAAQIPMMIPGIVGMGNGVADLGNKYLPEGLREAIGNVVPENVREGAHSISDAASSLTDWWANKARAAVGLPEGEPTTLAGQAEELAGQIFTPSGIAKIAPKIGSIAEQLAAVPKSLTGKLAFQGIGTGIDALLDAIVPQKSQPGASADIVQVPTTAAPKAADIMNTGLDQHQVKIDTLIARKAPQTVVDNGTANVGRIMANMEYKIGLKAQGADSSDWHVPTWAYVAATGIGAALAVKYLKGPKLFELGDAFGANKSLQNDALSIVDQLATGQIDRNIPITSTLRKAGNEHLAQLVDTTQQPGSLRTSVDSLLTTGKFSDAPDIKLPVLMDMANKFQSFGPDAETLANAIRAKDKLSYYKYNPSAGVGPGETVEELKDFVGTAEMDPRMSEFMQNYKQFTNGWVQYLQRQGVLNADTTAKFMKSDSFYMPNVVAEGKSMKLLDTFGLTPNPRNDGYLSSPAALLGRDTIPDGLKLVDPIRALSQYSMDMMDYARQNTIRRDFVDTMQSLGDSGSKEFGDLVTKLNKPSASALPIRRDGAVEYWDVKNRFMKQALQFQPQQLDGLLSAMNKIRHGFQFLTTGHGNPFAAPANFLYDAVGAAFLNDHGSPLGAFQGDVLGSTIRSAAGAYTGVKDRLVKQAYSYLNYAYNNDGVLSKLLGPETTKRLAIKAADAWQNSVTQMMEKFSASHGGLAADDMMYNKIDGILTDLTPEFTSKVPSARRAWQLYTSILDGLQSGARTAYFQKYGSTLKDYRSIVERSYQTRNLVGDFAKVGNSPSAQALRAIVPYYNPSVQSLARFGKVFAANPARLSAAIAGGALFPATSAALWMTQASQAHKQWYLNDLTPYERDAFVWVPKIDVQASLEQQRVVYSSPDQSIGIPLVPELRPLAAMARGIVLHLSGADTSLTVHDADRAPPPQTAITSALSNLLGLPETRQQADVLDATMQALPVGMPPVLQAGLNLAGSNVPLGAFAINDVKADPYTESDMDARMRMAIGSLFGWTGQFGLQVAGAYQKAQTGNKLDSMAQQANIQLGQKLPTVAGSLFGYQRKLANSTVDANIYFSKVKAIQSVASMTTSAKSQMMGRVGPAGNPMMAVGTLPNIVGDPNMMAAMQLVSRYSGPLQKLQSTVSKYKSLIDTTQARTDIGPKQKATIQNLATMRMHNAQNDVVRFIQGTVEHQLTQMVGKPTTVEDLDPHSALQ